MKNAFFLFIFFLTTFSCLGQKLHFRTYSVDEGLPQASLYSIYQDNPGYLWFGTQGGAARFDGQEFINYSQKNGLVENHVTSIYQDKDGNYWFGHRYDGISVKTGNAIYKFDSIPGLNSQVTDIIRFDGHILAATQEDGLFVLKTDSGRIIGSHQFTNDKLSNISRFFQPSKKVLWMLTMDGIYQLESASGNVTPVKMEHTHPAVSGPVYDIINGHANTFWIASATGIHHFTRDNGKPAPQPLRSIPMEQTKSAGARLAMDPEGRVWFTRSTGGGRIDKEGVRYFTAINGLSDSETNSVLADREGNIWFGMMGEGVKQYLGDAFESWDATTGLPDDIVQAVAIDSLSNAWIGTEKGVTIINRDGTVKHITTKEGLVHPVVNTIYHDSRNRTWVGTSNGISIITNGEIRNITRDNGLASNRIISISEDMNRDIWIASLGQGATQIEIRDDGSTGEFIQHTKETGFPTNAVWKLFKDSKGNLWFGSNDAGLVKFDGKTFDHINQEDGLPHQRPGSITEDGEGNLWLGTIGGGVVRYNPQTGSFKSFTTEDGIGSDNPYLVVCDLAGNVWVGTNYGIDRLDPSEKIRHFGKAEGFYGVETNQNAAALDPEGNIWFGTIKGVVKCNPARLTENKTPPLVHLNGVRVFLKDEEAAKASYPYNKNHLTFDFIGISYTNPRQVVYRYKLEGFDEDWQPATPVRFATYSNLPPGDYHFKVEAANKDGVWSSMEQGYQFSVTPPFWKTTWFYILSALGMAAVIYFSFLIRTKNLRRSKQQLEELVNIRTSQLREEKEKVEMVNQEVVLQKNIIELKNKDITASISYAKRIQEAILPPVSTLQAAFEDFFVLYRPKDIVSGDFYWFMGEGNQAILAVGDCTGHGVPGALMSMMGNDLLHNIVKERGITGAPAVLKILDERIRGMLKQDAVAQHSGEGMDLAFCTYNRKEKKLEFAGAFRPLFLIRKGELMEIKGDRLGIGGFHTDEKVFLGHQLELQDGDAFYLFTDGFADQFGGETGKKLMTKNFKKLLLEIHHLPMAEQQKKLELFFDEWKGDLEQVDDVCVVGVRV